MGHFVKYHTFRLYNYGSVCLVITLLQINYLEYEHKLHIFVFLRLNTWKNKLILKPSLRGKKVAVKSIEIVYL